MTTITRAVQPTSPAAALRFWPPESEQSEIYEAREGKKLLQQS